MVGSRLQGKLSPTFAKKKGQEDISLSPKALVVPMLLFKINENLGHCSHSVICETQIPRLYVISPKLTLIYKMAQVSPDWPKWPLIKSLAVFNMLTCEVFQLLKDCDWADLYLVWFASEGAFVHFQIIGLHYLSILRCSITWALSRCTRCTRILKCHVSCLQFASHDQMFQRELIGLLSLSCRMWKWICNMLHRIFHKNQSDFFTVTALCIEKT